MKSYVSSLGAAVLLATLAVAGCKQEAPSPDTAAASSAAAPDAKPGLAVSDAVLVLPAVKGRPGAAYFTVANTGPAPASLAAVHVDGAGKTELHESKEGKMAPLGPVAIAPGASIAFARGARHVMVFDIDARLTAGGTTEVTLTFADGDKVSVPVKIEAAGDAMAGMEHGSGR